MRLTLIGRNGFAIKGAMLSSKPARFRGGGWGGRAGMAGVRTKGWKESSSVSHSGAQGWEGGRRGRLAGSGEAPRGRGGCLDPRGERVGLARAWDGLGGWAGATSCKRWRRRAGRRGALFCGRVLPRRKSAGMIFPNPARSRSRCQPSNRQSKCLKKSLSSESVAWVQTWRGG